MINLSLSWFKGRLVKPTETVYTLEEKRILEKRV
jgi:hypothetical protein